MIQINIPIGIATCVSNAKRQLSKVGKRYKDANGNNVFAEITTSTAEDQALYNAAMVAVETVKVLLEEYISTYGYVPEDLEESDATVRIEGIGSEDNIHGDLILYIMVAENFNVAYEQTLSVLIPKYIEDAVLTDWWTAINTNQMELYKASATEDTVAIRRCFNKAAPAYPRYKYTRQIITGSRFTITTGNKYTVTYAIDAGAIDDIEARTDSRIISIEKGRRGFEVKAERPGEAHLFIYSKHDEDTTRVINVHVE